MRDDWDAKANYIANAYGTGYGKADLYRAIIELIRQVSDESEATGVKAGRKAGLGEARERLNAMADDYSVQADKALDSYGPVPYYTCLDKANALREGASAVKALGGGGE